MLELEIAFCNSFRQTQNGYKRPFNTVTIWLRKAKAPQEHIFYKKTVVVFICLGFQ